MHRPAVIFDFNRTLFDPVTYTLYPGAGAMLDELRDKYRLFLYSRRGFNRHKLLEDLNILHCFEGTCFVETKTAENLRAFMNEHSISTDNAIVVGDAIWSELCLGQELGMRTVWFKQGAVPPGALPCVPTHTVTSIPELHVLLRTT